MHRHLLTIVLSLTLTSPAYAGAWLQPQGKGELIGQATYYNSSHYFDFDGESRKQARFHKYEVQPYAEYGLFDNLTVGGSFYAQSLNQSDRNNYGIADPEIFARTRIWHDEKQTVSIQPLVKFGSRFKDKAPPRGGSKSIDGELAVLYGRNLAFVSDRDWLDVGTAYRMRSDQLGDQWRSHAAVGLRFTNKLTLVPALRATVAIDPNENAIYVESGDQDYSLLKAELTAMYYLNDQQWLQAGGFKDVYGVQTGDGFGLTVGYGQKF